MPDIQTMILILPELVLAIFGMLVMIVDLVGRENSEGVTPWVAALGFAVAFGAVLYIWGSRITIFGDMYALDPFALFFKLLASMAGLIVTLVSIDYLKNRTNAKGEFFSLLTFPC